MRSDALWSNPIDIGAAPVRLEGVPARAAADVDDLGARPDTEPVVVDGQHLATRSQRLLVHRNRLRRNGFPAEHVERAPTPVRAEPAQFQRRVEQFAEHRGQFVDVGRGDQPRAFAVGADHLGQRARAAGDDRGAAGHRLHGGQREAFVKRRDASDFGGRQQVGEFGVGQAAGAVHDVGDAQFGDQLLGRPVGLQLGDELEFEIALDAQPRHRVQQMADALERHVGAGDRDDAVAAPACSAGLNSAVSTPSGTTCS